MRGMFTGEPTNLSPSCIFLGEGTFEKLAGEVYEALRAKGGRWMTWFLLDSVLLMGGESYEAASYAIMGTFLSGYLCTERKHTPERRALAAALRHIKRFYIRTPIIVESVSL